MSRISSSFIKEWNQGTQYKAHAVLGAHHNSKATTFAVWAPNAYSVSVVGDFNNWDGRRHPMERVKGAGLWQTHTEPLEEGTLYKYEIKQDPEGPPFLKSDPYARSMELRPQTASRICAESTYQWGDQEWLQQRGDRQRLHRPFSIYEVHLGSWKRRGPDGNAFLSYRELAEELVPYVSEMGFTHIELMPLAEHPHDPSWGYQITGFFAPTSRFGEPDGLRYLIDQCHQHDIGVILDWVPGHFPKDEHGLQYFDGTPLYEGTDPKNREQKDWGTYSFDYKKEGVRNFLLSNACYWCEQFHIDGLRVDAVASMLYLDYSKGPGDWTPNEYGGKENLEAISFLKEFNGLIGREYPGVRTFAEESTAWNGVTDSEDQGGLGFDFKWNMGWMNDTLSYMEKEEDQRRVASNKITFPMMYNASEQFVLPLSHDEVVHLKKPLVKKSSGTSDQQLANLRVLFTYLYGHPGKKLLFMGGEFAETEEWSERRSLNWELLKEPGHRGIQRMVYDLNRLYCYEPALHEIDRAAHGFEWIELGDTVPALFAFLRKAENSSDHLLFVLNFSKKSIEDLSVGPFEGLQYHLIFNSDSAYYEGGNTGGHYGQGESQYLNIPPYSGFILQPV